MNNLITILKGGSGSGDFGHVGRAGKRGGSGGGGGKGRPRKGRRSREALDKEIEAGKKKSSTQGEVTDAIRNLDKDPNIAKLHANFDSHKADLDSPDFSVAEKISMLSGVSKWSVDGYQRNWNTGTFALMHHTAQSAVRSLRTRYSSYEEANRSKWQKSIDDAGIPEEVNSDNDKITRAVYDETQKQLRAMGSKDVILYRGMSGKSDISHGEIGNYESNSLDSWTTDIETAREYAKLAGAGFIMKTSMPAERIFSMSSSGPGTSIEREMIVLGIGNDEVLIVS